VLFCLLLSGGGRAVACDLYSHVWTTVSASASSALEADSVRAFLGHLEGRLPAVNGTWLLCSVSEAGVAAIASAVATPELSDRFVWGGVVRPGAEGGAPAGMAGRLLLDILNPSATLLFQVDTSLGPVNLMRLARLDRFTARVVCSVSDGEIAFLDEIPWSEQLEWDLLLPAHCLAGGIWMRRVAWRVTPMEKRLEWMAGYPPGNREALNTAPPDVEFRYLPIPELPRSRAPGY